MKTQGDTADDFEPVQTTRAFEEVAAQIRRRVIHGQLRAGDRLPSERDLALKLGVGRSTVREALRGLEIAGVVRSSRGVSGGACVVAPDGQVVSMGLQDMFQLGSVTPAQLTEARLEITASVVRLACARIDEAGLRALEDNVKASRAASDANDLATRSRINMDFHRLLAAQTGNPVFVSIMDGLIGVMHSFMEKLGPPSGDEVYASRRRFIAHMRRRDADAAINEMERFLRGMHRHYLSRLDDQSRS